MLSQSWNRLPPANEGPPLTLKGRHHRHDDKDRDAQTPTGRDVLGPGHPDRGQPGNLHQDRFRRPPRGRMPQHLVDLPRLQRLHEGEGPAGRPFHHEPHLRHLRRQPCDLRLLRAEHGVRRPSAGTGRVDHQPGRGGRIHVRPLHLPGQPGGGRFLRANGPPDQSARVALGRRRRHRTPSSTVTARSPTSCVRSPPSRARSTSKRCK